MSFVGSGGRLAVLPGTTSLANAPLRVAVSEILLVGAEAVAARGVIERQIAVESKGEGVAVRIETAESLLEAVLVSGERTDATGQAARGKLFVVGVGQESEHLEAGLRSLKRVNPSSRVVLLCEPTDEVLCRKAKAWGAEEYYISPLDMASARQVLLPPSPGAAPLTVPMPAGRLRTLQHFQESAAGVLSSRELTAPAGRGAAGAMAGGAELPSLPLIVQTELLDDLLNGRADFVQRAIGAVAEHLGVGGKLRFVATGADGADEDLGRPGAIRRVVSAPDQPTFGTLILEPEAGGGALAAPAAAALAQVGNWLGGMLALARRYEQLRSLAITDELSGAYNRRYFSKYMASLLERARENRFRVTLLLFDIDDFKKYNDTFGHASGDAIIRELIKLLRACTRPHDLVARIGGDEFAVVYWDNEAPRQPNSEHPKDVLVATERFREAIKNHHWPQTCNIKGEVSISGGLATFPWDADTLEILMAKADEALLRAKSTGKNVIVMHGAGTGGAAPVQRVGT